MLLMMSNYLLKYSAIGSITRFEIFKLHILPFVVFVHFAIHYLNFHFRFAECSDRNPVLPSYKAEKKWKNPRSHTTVSAFQPSAQTLVVPPKTHCLHAAMQTNLKLLVLRKIYSDSHLPIAISFHFLFRPQTTRLPVYAPQ